MSLNLQIKDLGYCFLFLSGINLIIHFYLIFNPYSYAIHISNFTIIGTLLIYGYQWYKSKSGELPTIVTYFRVEQLLPLNWLVRTIDIYAITYCVIAFVFLYYLDKEISFLNQGASTAAFMFLVLSGFGRYYIFHFTDEHVN